MNMESRKMQKTILFFFNLMNNDLLENLCRMRKKRRDIKFPTTEARKNYLVSEQNYYTTRKAEIFMNKPVYLGLTILKNSKTVIYEFSYVYVKLK